MAAPRENLNTWIEIDSEAFASNLAFFRSLLAQGTELAAVVKANAYGHGLREIAGIARAQGVDTFAVHSIEEARDLRAAGASRRILLLGPAPPRGFDDVLSTGVEPVISTCEALTGLAEACRRAGASCGVHVKLETGTHRQGIDSSTLDRFLRILDASPGLTVVGVCTHFANIEDTINQEYAFRQLQRFEDLAARVERAGHAAPMRHTTCTAAVLLLKESRMDMVRLGIGLYGLWPSRETYISFVLASGMNHVQRLKPVMSWKTRISEVKDVPADSYVGYGCSFRTTHASRIAVLPVGYFDGYSRSLSNSSHVLVRGRRAPVRGRVCMNLMMVDTTDIPEARVGDEAVLIGRSGQEQVTADDLASIEKTIHYEVVTRVNPAIPRMVV